MKNENQVEEDSEDSAADQPKVGGCVATLKSGTRKGLACGNKTGPDSQFCGRHVPKPTKEATAVGTGKDRSLGSVILLGHVWACNVAGSSQDNGKWKTFYCTHTKEEYPARCRVKDCERKATATGHLYLRAELEDEAMKMLKYNYLVPICGHHNSSVYDVKCFELKKDVVAVRIRENPVVEKKKGKK